jgi:hypothetical protein
VLESKLSAERGAVQALQRQADAVRGALEAEKQLVTDLKSEAKVGVRLSVLVVGSGGAGARGLAPPRARAWTEGARGCAAERMRARLHCHP